MPHPPSLCLCVAVVLASLSVVQSCFTDASLTGGGGAFKTADPCQCDPTSAPFYRCNPQRPPAGQAQRDPLSTTIILPSDASAAGPGGVATGLPAGGQSFTLRGRDLADRLTQPGVPFSPNAGSLFLAAAGATQCPAMNTATGLVPVNVNANGESLTFTLSQGDGWTTAARTVETSPRLLCYAYANAPADQALWTGFRVAVAWNCDNSLATSNQNCNQFNPQTGLLSNLLTTEQQSAWANRTVCCKGSGGLQVGVCVNPRTHTCCGGIPVQPNLGKCCNAVHEWVQYPEEPCWCTRAGSVATPPDCPSAEPNCCLPTKYPEFNYSTSAVGQCYNASLHRCCNTGQRYDPGTDQCCSINGLQTLNFPCPCGADTDCRGGQTVPNPLDPAQNQTLDHQCCKQTEPTPYETEYCSIYANYPSGTGDYRAQRCLGHCFDPSYQICCNGVTCIRSYEKCCNATCCNTMIGTCHENARHPGSPANMFNWVGLNDTFVQCTTIEQINPIKAFWIFILPTGLLLATLLGLALALVFANKASTRMFTPIDKAWIAVAVLVIIFALPHFFSPEYKYGLLVVIAALFSILSASIRSKTMNVVTIAVIGLVLLYLFDPFTGNSIASMVTGRLAGGEPSPDRNGLLESTRSMVWRNAQEGSIRSCTQFYEYFNHDPKLMDYERWDNDAVNTFGYCSRAWAFALLMFTAALFILMGLLFVLALLDLMRFRQPGPHDPYSGFEPIELEVQPTQPEDAIIVE